MAEQHIFNTFWEGEYLTPIENLCLRSFVNHGHSLRLFTYNGAQVPEGVTLEDARQILRTVKDEAKRLRDANLKSELRRRNWKADEKGRWTPPEVHDLPPSGFIENEESQ